MAAYLVGRMMMGFPIETNILALLPETQKDPLTEQAYRQFETATGRKTVFLVGSADTQEAKAAAGLFFGEMERSGLFNDISFRVDSKRAENTYQVYAPHRQSLLSVAQREALLDGQPERIVGEALKSLTSPVSMTGSAGLAKDPLFTFTEFLRELQSQAGTFVIDEDMLLAKGEAKQYVILVGALQDNAFSITAQSRFKTFYDRARTDLQREHPEVELLSAGVIHHAIAGTDSARSDISTIGLGSVLGLIVLILIAFRSPVPLMISAVPLLGGFIAALTLCIIAFGNVHLFTLVFGSSLIGVSIDYSFHYLAERQSAGSAWNPEEALHNIFPGITLGLVTSLAAYLALAVAPFSGLQQIAVFSAAGLTAAYVTVVLWYPLFFRAGTPRREPITFRLSRSYVALWDRYRPKHWAALFLVFALPTEGYLALHLRADDNIRALQNSPQRILAEENQVKEIVGTSSGTQFFVVRGASVDEVLTTEEKLTVLLDESIKRGALKRYRALSKVLPSPSRQRQNYALLREQVLDESSALSRFLQEMGFEEEVVRNYRLSFQAEKSPTLSVEELLKSPLGDLYGPLWMSRPQSGQFASILILDEVTDIPGLRKLETLVERTAFVSRADDISELLRTYREMSSRLVAGAYFSIFLLLLFRYRPRIALAVIIPPLGAGMAALAVTLALGIPLNMFNTLALVLVLGIGIDYTIFFAEKSSHRATTMHAVFLSAVTTILSFGLLALSSTPVISSFGLMVFVGISVSLLLAPVAQS